MSESKVCFRWKHGQKITANDLVLALNEAYGLGMDTDNIFSCYLVAENPIAFLRGNKTLKEFGIRNGSYIMAVPIHAWQLPYMILSKNKENVHNENNSL